MDGTRDADAKPKCEADGSVPRVTLVPTMCQLFVGVDGRGPKLLGRKSENQSLVSFLATVLSEKGNWRS